MRYCVFCGSNSGLRPEYREAAVELGTALARRGIGLVYGGAANGLMGAVADAVLARGGEAIGVIPQHLLDREVGHRGLTELYVTASMHERKARMASLSDGFLALPGGIGTFEELFEIWTWAMLGHHAKPCALLNVAGYYDRLAGFLDFVVEEGFLKPQHRALLLEADSIEAALDALEERASAGAPRELERT